MNNFTEVSHKIWLRNQRARDQRHAMPHHVKRYAINIELAMEIENFRSPSYVCKMLDSFLKIEAQERRNIFVLMRGYHAAIFTIQRDASKQRLNEARTRLTHVQEQIKIYQRLVALQQVLPKRN